MHNFKKIAALSLGTVCLLASCNKTLSVDGVKKFVENTYANKTVKKLASLEVIGTAKINTDDADIKTQMNEVFITDSQIFGIDYKDKSYSLRGFAKKDSAGFIQFEGPTFCGSILNKNDIENYERKKTENPKLEGNVTYTTNNNELSVYCNFAVKTFTANSSDSGEITELDIYNNNGQLRYAKGVQKFTHGNESVTYTITYACTFEN